MDVDTLSKGKSKGKAKKAPVGSGMGNKGQNQVASEEHADEWWTEEHVDGWWKDEETGSSSSSGWWTTANDQTPWEPEGPVGGFEINGVEQKYIKHDR